MPIDDPARLNVWQLDGYGVLNLHTRTPEGFPVHAYICKRPAYCDRGHWHLNIDGPLELDEADRFPRYYFSLEHAVEETERFLRWRIHHARDRVEHADELSGRVFTP